MLLPITRRQIAAVLAPKQATRLAMFEVVLFSLCGHRTGRMV